jgi:hypothetical protein
LDNPKNPLVYYREVLREIDYDMGLLATQISPHLLEERIGEAEYTTET